MINLLDLDRTALEAFCVARGEKPYRARQVLRWVHRALVDRIELMSDLGTATRAALARDGAEMFAVPGLCRFRIGNEQMDVMHRDGRGDGGILNDLNPDVVRRGQEKLLGVVRRGLDFVA